MDHRLALKIRNGTRSGKRLCDSCQYGHVMKGDAESEELIHCSQIDNYIPVKVVECSSYIDKTITPLHEMKAMAWQIRTDKSGQQIGFVSPEKWRALVRAQEVVDDDE